MADTFPKNMLSTGSTLLNLELADNPFGGLLAGRYFYFVGDSASGKTFLSMTCCAEASLNPNFLNYRLIHDNVEDGMLMNLDTLFSEQVADRIEAPATNPEGGAAFSGTIEDFYYNLDDALFAAGWDTKKKCASGVKDPRPFLYILDSMDSLDSEAADKKFHEHKAAYRKKQTGIKRADGEPEDKLAGSYGDGKAKKNSEFLRHAMKGLRNTGSILIILSQTRDNIGGYGGSKTRAGGRALRFYATVEVWSSIRETLKRNVNGKDRQIGIRSILETKKNRITGKLAKVEIDIYWSHGIDDMGTCVDYLVEENFWPLTKQTIDARGLLSGGVVGTRDKIIRVIERKNLEDRVRELCGQCWQQVGEACTLKRKNRYAPTEPDDEEGEE